MTDPRLERDLREVLAMDAPDDAPAELRDRVAADLARRGTARGRAPWLAAAAAVLIVALGTIVVIGPRFGQPPTGSQSPGTSASPGNTSTIETPFATIIPTAPAFAEPITDPGQLVGADPITATFGIATNADGLVLVTSTNATTWRDVTPDSLRDSGLEISAEGLDPLHLRLVTWNDNQRLPALWTSSDSGASWARIDLPNRRTFSGVTFLDPEVAWVLDESPRGLDPEIAWTGDGGRTWSDLEAVVPPDGFTFASLSFVTRELGFMAAYDADQHLMSMRTVDGGITWSAVSFPPEFAHPLGEPISSGFVFSDAERGYGTESSMRVVNQRVSIDRRVFVTGDGGSTWSFAFELEMEGRWSLVRFDDDTWMANNGTQRRLTTDGGRTWQVDDVSGLPDPAGYVSAEFVDQNDGWAGSARACLSDFCPLLMAHYFKTTDGGLTWSRIGGCPPESKGEFCDEPAQ